MPLPPLQNRATTAALMHNDHIQHVIACEQPIGVKRKRSFEYSTGHGLFNDTNHICMARKLGYNFTVLILKTKLLNGPIRSTML